MQRHIWNYAHVWSISVSFMLDNYLSQTFYLRLSSWWSSDGRHAQISQASWYSAQLILSSFINHEYFLASCYMCPGDWQQQAARARSWAASSGRSPPRASRSASGSSQRPSSSCRRGTSLPRSRPRRPPSARRGAPPQEEHTCDRTAKLKLKLN